MNRIFSEYRIPTTGYLFTRYKHILCITGCFILAVILSCHPQKKITREPVKGRQADSLFALLKKNEFQFEWLNIKFSADFSVNKKGNSFNGNIRIRKDSAIWVSISPALGIEAVRLLITSDSVKMLNRLNDTYFAGDFRQISNILKAELDFDMLQSLLIGNDFSFYENDVFKASVDQKQYLLSTVGRGKLKKHFKSREDSLRILVQDIWLNPETYKITKVHIKQLRGNRKLEADYNDFETVNNMFFPAKIEFGIVDEKEKIEVKIENSRITTTGPLEFPYNVSKKYIRTGF